MPEPIALLIEGSDFETFPAGGQLTMAKALMKSFGDRLALVGMDNGDVPGGRWIRREIAGMSYQYFSVCRRIHPGRRPLIPARLSFYVNLRRYQKEILSLGCKAALIQAPEALLAVSRWNWSSLCYWFAGVEGTLRVSRYPFVKALSYSFDKAVFSALDRASVILAAADENAIKGLVRRSNGRLSMERVIQLPTCVDTSVFQPASADSARAELGISKECPLFVSVGRIGRFKGWDFLVEAFEQFLSRSGAAFLVFVGDGEDRRHLQARIDARGLGRYVSIAGFQQPNKVGCYLNAANAVVCGSLQEGWSVAMLEALACGKPIVSTEVSGVGSMIKQGQNGFIVRDRDPSAFAEAMERALHLPNAEQISASIANHFSLVRMTETLARIWSPLQSALR